MKKERLKKIETKHRKFVTKKRYDMCYIELGDMGGGDCNSDRKHCYFHWELNYGLHFSHFSQD